MEIRLETIEMDASIQCRAAIDTATVGEYAERMQVELEKFPAVVLFGTAGRSWIGDGWHRVFAARQIGLVGIKADLRAGGRKEALQHALGANAANGLRRTNADKRRCVEIAIKEFGKLSSRAIAELCGVGADMVIAHRPLSDSDNATRTTSDGRQYPASRKPSIFAPDAPEADPLHDSGEEDTDAPDATTGGKEGEHKMNTPKRPVGMEYAMTAIDALKRIPLSDPMRSAGFAEVAKFIKHEMKGITK